MYNGQLTSIPAIRSFIIAGHATVTLKSKKTGSRYTYKVSVPREQNADRPIWFVSLLSGPDNEHSYQYFGNLRPHTFEVGRNSRISADAPSVRAFRWFYTKVLQEESEAALEQLEVWHEGHCGRCGRKLTVPESIESGFGPECIKHI